MMTTDTKDIHEVDGARFVIVYEGDGWWSATPDDDATWGRWRIARRWPGTIERFKSVDNRRGFPLGQLRRESRDELLEAIGAILMTAKPQSEQETTRERKHQLLDKYLSDHPSLTARDYNSNTHNLHFSEEISNALEIRDWERQGGER